MPYPDAPWHLHGQLWLSLFAVRRGEDAAHPDRPAGVHGVALVSYEHPSPLVYSELLVARPVGLRAQVTDIWVDSPDSRDGGRELWAIPKGLATFGRTSDAGRVERTAWEVRHDGAPSLSARFEDVARQVPVRLPFAFSTQQVRADGEVVLARVTGSGRVSPARATWEVDGRGRSPGWQASGPWRRSGSPTSRCRSAAS